VIPSTFEIQVGRLADRRTEGDVAGAPRREGGMSRKGVEAMGPILRSNRLPHLPTTRVVICLCGLLIAASAPAHASGFAFRDTYARPEILADVAWLAERIGDPTVRVVDARVPFEWALYEAGHIPGAVFADMFFGVPIMPASAFADAMGQLGIDDDTTVVIYDTDGGAWAARLWWALKFHGHDRAMMLNGGLRQWILAGLPIERTALRRSCPPPSRPERIPLAGDDRGGPGRDRRPPRRHPRHVAAECLPRRRRPLRAARAHPHGAQLPDARHHRSP
jgi:rhodanese-related sulfurtransferase